MRYIKSFITEELEYKKYGNKVKVAEIFKHEQLNDYNVSKNIDVYTDDESFEKNSSVEVDVKDIVPTQRFLTIKNLDKVKKDEQDNTGAYLVKFKGLYYILDGHHRIANKIINEYDTIKAFVQEVK